MSLVRRFSLDTFATIPPSGCYPDVVYASKFRLSIHLHYVAKIGLDMVDSRKSRVELGQEFDSAAWREKFLDLLALVALLRECIIEKGYKPSEDLSSAISLTDAGTKVRTQLTTKEGVNAKDAKVLTLLALVHLEPLVDVESIELDRLAEAISNEMKMGALRYPLIFGRDLYDRAADLFKEEREYLNHEDTLRLLDATEQGVFHVGHYLIGPFGVFRTSFSRNIAPTTAVPIQHCADSGCHAVHHVQLTTSIDAGVNRSRPALNKVLEQLSEEPSEWNGFISDIGESTQNDYNIADSDTMPFLVGDAFSDEELRQLILFAPRTTEGRMIAAAKTLGFTGVFNKFVEALSRAEALQLLFMLSDDDLSGAIDAAIRDEIVVIPGDEIRRPKVNARTRSGAWRLRSEVSRLGIRQVGADRALPILRISSLARRLFDVAEPKDMDELAWILRSTSGNTPGDQLEEFLRTSEPAEIVQTLVLARKSNADFVCRTLGIPLDQSDDLIRDSILWKLGFPLPRSRDSRDEYWKLHDGLESLAKTAQVDVSSTAEGLRATSSDYFVALEKFLLDSLTFAAWALLSDHFESDEPFVYLSSSAQPFASKVLTRPTDSDPNVVPSKDPVLSELVEGFIRLSKLLSEIQADESKYLRDENKFPKFSAKTPLQQFPFRHTHPFLDLVAESQFELIRVLAEVGSGLNDSGIMTARNGLLHSKQRVPTIAEVTQALEKSRRALDQLESIGCVRSTFATTSSLMNAWGRVTTTLVSHGRSISFTSPSAFEWVRLPTFSKPHYLMQGAVFASPNEMLRFSEGFESEFQTYWSRYPTRPEPGNKVLASQSESLAAQTDTGAYSSSRIG